MANLFSTDQRIFEDLNVKMKRMFYFATMVFLFISCREKDDPIKAGESIASGEVTDITYDSAVLWGYVDPIVILPGVEIGFLISISENPSVENGMQLISIEVDKNNKFFVEINNLAPNTKYHYKAFANSGGTYRVGDVKSFTTKDIPVLTKEATDITYDTAVLWGYADLSEVRSAAQIGILVSTSDNPSEENGTKFFGVKLDNNDNYCVKVSNLTHNTRYYYKAFVNVGNTYRDGAVKSFTTEPFMFEAVDLGLSVKWANANVGATTPEDYGEYYAWGETETKEYYLTNYKWSNDSFKSFTKYNTNGNYGIVDNKIVLDIEDDVANVKLGGKWRMPTNDELMELQTQCIWTWTMHNGVRGCLVTGKNGNNIFLPAAGYRHSNSHINAGISGDYWSSTLKTDSPESAWCLNFWTTVTLKMDYASRHLGIPIRSVLE